MVYKKSFTLLVETGTIPIFTVFSIIFAQHCSVRYAVDLDHTDYSSTDRQIFPRQQTFRVRACCLLNFDNTNVCMFSMFIMFIGYSLI